MEGGGLGRVDAELHDRDIGLGIDVQEHRPGAVIQSPGSVRRHRQRRQHVLNATRQGGRAGRGILDLIQLRREAAEVVDGLRRGCNRDGRAGPVPVRGDGQDRVRPGRFPPHAPPGLRVAVAGDGVHRIAVAEKDRGQPGGHRSVHPFCVNRGPVPSSRDVAAMNARRTCAPPDHAQRRSGHGYPVLVRSQTTAGRGVEPARTPRGTVPVPATGPGRPSPTASTRSRRPVTRTAAAHKKTGRHIDAALSVSAGRAGAARQRDAGDDRAGEPPIGPVVPAQMRFAGTTRPIVPWIRTGTALPARNCAKVRRKCPGAGWRCSARRSGSSPRRTG